MARDATRLKYRCEYTTNVLAAIEDIRGMGRLSKFDYFSRSLADINSARCNSALSPEAKPRTHE